jgi:hypothetical protein
MLSLVLLPVQLNFRSFELETSMKRSGTMRALILRLKGYIRFR